MAVDASRLTLLTTKLLNAFQQAISEASNELIEEQRSPWEYRYGILTAHIMALGDCIGASPGARDREVMLHFLAEGGMEMVRTISDRKAEVLAERRAANDD